MKATTKWKKPKFDITKPIFFDTETEGGLYGTTRLIQVGQGGTEIVFDVQNNPKLLKKVIKYLTDKHIVVHNGFYDFFVEDIHTIKPKTVFDTLWASRYLYPQDEKHSLTTALQREGLNAKEELGASDWSGELTKEQIAYAKYDVEALELLYNIYQPKLKNNDAWTSDMKNLVYAYTYSWNGIAVDHTRRLAFVKEYEEKLAEVVAKLPEGLNFNSPKQLCEWLGIKSSNREVLTNLSYTDARGLWVMQAKDYSKKISTLTKKFNFDRVRGVFKPGGAKSGRWTCSGRLPGQKDPMWQNLQQIDRKLKTCFKAEDGKYLVECDYSGLETYTASAVMNSEKMMSLLIDGVDLHTYVASFVFGVKPKHVTKDQRQCAKGVTFGTLYGAGAKVVQIFIQTYTGELYPLGDVEKFRARWLSEFDDIKLYHAVAGHKISNKRGLFVETPMGRRAWAKSYSESINIPSQGAGAECMKIAMELVMTKLPDAKIVLTVHDELVIECDTLKQAKKTAKVVKKAFDKSFEVLKTYLPHSDVLDKLHMDNEVDITKNYQGEPVV
jgi:DNA polymerase-1